MTGSVLSVNQIGYYHPYQFQLTELLAFEDFTVQQNAKGVTMSSVATGSSGSNALRMSYIANHFGNQTLCSTTQVENYPSISVTMKAQAKLSIVLVPQTCNSEQE